MITAESKRTGDIVSFTVEQWRALENTGHAMGWKIIDEDLVPDEPMNFQHELEVEFDYTKLLDDEGISYDKRIKDPGKLKKIYMEKTGDAQKEPAIKEENNGREKTIDGDIDEVPEQNG